MKNDDFIHLEYSKEGNYFKLQLFFAKDERGIVYRVTSVLSANNWNILSASIRSLENGQIEDEFLIQNDEGKMLDETEITLLKNEIKQLFLEEISITSYLIKKNKKIKTEKGNPNAILTFQTSSNEAITKLRIQTKDRSGLLSDIARMLYLECVDILSVQAKTIGDNVDDLFEIQSESGYSLDSNMQAKLERNLKNIL
jgi:[protein-PII] uridylyltransferase